MNHTDTDVNLSLVVLKPSEEQVLSQNFSQLSLTTIDNNLVLHKDIKKLIETIPDFLTQRSESLRQVIHDVLLFMTNATSTKNKKYKDYMRKLQHITFVLYKILVIQKYENLWKTYLKSGTGQLMEELEDRSMYSIDIKLWPKELRSIIQSTSKNKIIDDKACMDFVNNTLQLFDKYLKQYLMELKNLAMNLSHYTFDIQQTLMMYIQENLSHLIMDIAHKIELVHFDFHIRRLKLEYLQHQPNKYEKQIMKQICQSKYSQELTEQEYHLLKQKIAFFNSSLKSFDYSSMAKSILCYPIEDPQIRQNYYEQFKFTCEKIRADLFAIYMEFAEQERREYKEIYDKHVNKYLLCEHSIREQEELSPDMLRLIHERSAKISQRILCIYKVKKQSFL